MNRCLWTKATVPAAAYNYDKSRCMFIIFSRIIWLL